MKFPFLPSVATVCVAAVCAIAVCAVPVRAQPDVPFKPINGLPFALVTPEQAEKLADLKPIKLDLNDVTLRAALEELGKQSGVEFDFARDAPAETLDKTLSIHLETRSFDQAFAEIIGEAGAQASLRPNDDNRSWIVAWGQTDTSKESLQSQTGLFAVRLMRLGTTLSKTLTLASAEGDRRDEQNYLAVFVNLSSDKRLPLVGVPRTFAKRADDEAGRSLIAPREDPLRNYSAYSFYNGNSAYERMRGSMLLRAPEKDAKTLAHLEGIVVYALVSKTETWEVPDLLSQPEWKHSFKSGDQNFAMTIKPTLKAEKNLTLAIEVSANLPLVEGQVGPPLLASTEVIKAMKIVDANGLTLRSNGYGGGGGQKLTMTTTFYPSNRNYGEDKTLALPLKFVFDAPVEIVQTQVPFSFESVPLP